MTRDRTTLRMERAKRLRSLREAAGIDQGEFAAQLNERARARGVPVRYDQTKVSKFEHGRQDIGFDDAVLIGDVLGVAFDVLAFGDAAPPEPDEAADLAAFERLQALAAEREATERSSSRRAAGGHPTRSGRRGKGK